MPGNETEKEKRRLTAIVYTYSESGLFEIVFGKFGNLVYRVAQKQPSRGVLRKACSENMQYLHFDMGVLLENCCIFLEHLLQITLLEGCF